jgi:hypothetical protein
MTHETDGRFPLAACRKNWVCVWIRSIWPVSRIVVNHGSGFCWATVFSRG